MTDPAAPAPHVEVRCNGAPLRLPGTPTVADLLAVHLDDPRPHGVAVAVDGEVVPRDDWARHPLREGDEVEVVSAVQGG